MLRYICVYLAMGIVCCVTEGGAQQAPSPAPGDTIGYSAAECPSCAEWNTPAEPVQLHGNTYYVGTKGLAALLITSPAGHVLIDGGLPNSAPQIIRNIRGLGFREQDVRLILNSHVHYDHAGGLAALQRMTGAVVAASARSAPVLRTGQVGEDDPQYGTALASPAVSRVEVFRDGDTLRVGPVALVAHLTPGHTPGGTSWTWRSCDGATCLNFVYADSQTPVSADDFYFTRSPRYPEVLQDFERGFAKLEKLSCDVLITPHPAASKLWDRVGKQAGAQLVDSSACRRYVEGARATLARRVADEQK
jgi:metallo-beta-lactamase class B